MIRCKSILATTVLTLSVVFSLFPEPRAAAGSKGLFTESRSPVQFRAQSNSRSLRSRHVKIDFDLLGDARGFRRASQKGRQSLELNLFPDVSFVAVLDKIEPHAKGYSWIGRVQGSQDSIVILTVTDNVMAGNVSVSGTAYQIRHIEAGVHAIREVDPAATRPEAEPIQVGSEQGIPTFGTPSISPDQGGKSDSSPDRTYFLPGSNASFAVSPDAPSFPQSGSGEFFDLLVVYTASARSAAGGTAGIESLIQLGVTETNLAYQNSGIISQIRLVHTAEVNYTESGNLDTDLAYAQLGFVDNTHALRDTYGADLVQLVTDSNASFWVHPVNGEVPPVKGRPRKLPHYANRGKTSSSGGELASARSCFSTVRTALGKLRITGLLAQFDIARSFPQFPRPLLLQPTILTSERGTRFGIRKAPNHVPPPHLPDDPVFAARLT